MKRLSGICIAVGSVCVLQAAQGYSQQFYTNATAYREGVLYTGAPGGRFLAVELRSRRLAWAFQDAGLDSFLGPAFTDEGVFLLARKTSWETEAIGLDRSTGRVLWRYPFVEAARTSSPVVCDGAVILTDYKTGRLVALDARFGTVRWNTKDEPYHFFSPPATSGPQLYFVIKDQGADVGRGIAILKCSDGKPQRIIQVEGIGTSDCPIVLHGGKVILTDVVYDAPSYMMLVDLQTERKLWQIRIPSIHVPGSCPSVVDDRLVFGAGGLWVLDLKTGQTLADHEINESTSGTVVYDNSIVFMAGSRRLSAFRINPFALVWRTRLPGILASAVVVCGDAVCVQTYGEKLAMLDALSGKLRGYIALDTAEVKHSLSGARKGQVR